MERSGREGGQLLKRDEDFSGNNQVAGDVRIMV